MNAAYFCGFLLGWMRDRGWLPAAAAPLSICWTCPDVIVPALSHRHPSFSTEIPHKNLSGCAGGPGESLVGCPSGHARPGPGRSVCSRSGTTVTFETLAASGHFLHFDYELPQLWDGLYGPLNNGWASGSRRPGTIPTASTASALAHFYARWCRPVLDKT